ncbi:hypothetical protein [Dactylosporangium sp. NPDC049140]|uniref:hypothetical protein n=1 Tax=Dactylosporangium sp. NPDC049140 TaxID=3155647 RepID=UPI003404BA7D
MVSALRLEPLLFAAEFGSHRMRIFVDGVDVVAAAYGPGGFCGKPVAGFMPSRLLGPHGLAASQNVREVALGGSDTTEDQLTVQIRQVGSAVIWDRWRMVDIETVVKEGPDVGLSTFRFDARAYASELARATAQADRMWPARSVAELLEAMLWRDGYDQDGGTWVRRYTAIRAPEERPDVVEISYYARDMSGLRYAMPGSYVATFPVVPSDPDHQAQVIAHRLGHEDLKPVSVHRPQQRRR